MRFSGERNSKKINTPQLRETLIMETLHYPPTKMVHQVDDYHGTSVADPYRWLEDTDSPETKEWITLGIDYAKNYNLNRTQPQS
jgi:protease II